MKIYFNNELIFVFLSIFISIFSYHKLIPLFSRNFIDKPNLRSSHNQPSPTGGGIIFAVIVSIFSLLKGNIIPILCLPISVVGLIDDKKNLSRKNRLLAQFATVFMFLCFCFVNDNLLPWIDSKFILFLFIPILIFFSGIINLVNFCDGLNGLLSGSMIILFGFYTIYFNTQFIFVIPCLLVFLIFNWTPSKIFMGDSGSLFLGSLYVYILISANSIKDFVILFAILCPILLDVVSGVIRRYSHGYNIFKAHRTFLFQRLVFAGYSHSKVTSIYLISTFIFALLAIFSNFTILFCLIFLLCLFGFFLDKYVAVNFHKVYETKMYNNLK